MAVHGTEPGESEYSWGKGLSAPAVRGYEPTNFDEMKRQMAIVTDIEGADVEYGEATRPGFTPRVREVGPSSKVGQHKPVDTSVYTEGHYADGQQDGLGDAWRASLPPNPVV